MHNTTQLTITTNEHTRNTTDDAHTYINFHTSQLPGAEEESGWLPEAEREDTQIPEAEEMVNEEGKVLLNTDKDNTLFLGTKGEGLAGAKGKK